MRMNKTRPDKSGKNRNTGAAGIKAVRGFRARLRAFRDDRAGVIAIITAILFPVMVGFAGVGLDVSDWYQVRREMQAAADSAAISGAWELNTDPDNVEIVAEADALRNSFRDQGVATIVATSPPTSGPFAGDASAVQVSIQKDLELFFSDIFLTSPISASVTATARLGNGAGLCVLSLAETGTGIELSGSSSAQLGCGILSNSISNNSVTLSGNTELTADPIASAGQIETTGNPTINSSSQIEGSARGKDPYADLAVPTPESCDADHTNVTVTGTTSLSPGTYCGNLRVNANATVTFEPGEYVIDGGDLNILGNTDVSGEDVTIIMTASDGVSYGNLNLSGNSDLLLSAPTSGDFSGVLFFQDPSAPVDGTNSITGSSDFDVTGAFYFPSQEIAFSGSSDINVSCVQLIGLKVSFSGSSDFQNANDCDTAGTAPLTLPVVRLVD